MSAPANHSPGTADVALGSRPRLPSPLLWAAAALALVTSVVEIVWQARTAMFSFDEIVNADAARNLLLYGDYTTRQFRGFPFDPVISSGILTTWPDGLVFVLGGSLFHVRVIARLLQLACTVGLVGWFLRRRGVRLSAAVVIGLILWLILVGNVDPVLRITRGELWSVLPIALAMMNAERRPGLSAMMLGASVWLGKIIYLPFAAALLMASAWLPESRGNSLTNFRRLGLFWMPLLLWVGLIAVSYDVMTAVRWFFTFVAFVLRHSTGLQLPLEWFPHFENWPFHPIWDGTSFLSLRAAIALPFLAPIAIATLLLLVYAPAAIGGAIRSSPAARAHLLAAGATVIAFTIWFLAFDPTQWARHLLPAGYVATGMSVYIVAELARSTRRWPRALAVTIVMMATLFAVRTGAAVWAQSHADAWKSSYSQRCFGDRLLTGHCMADRSLPVLLRAVHEVCPEAGDSTYDVCLKLRRAELLAKVVATLRPNPDDDTNLMAGYLVRYLQAEKYQHAAEFAADLRPHLCGDGGPALRRQLEELGFDLSDPLLSCAG